MKVPADNGERGLNAAGPRRLGDWHSPASSASAPGAFVRDEAFLVNGAKGGERTMYGQENRTRVVIDGRKAGEGFDECFLKNRCTDTIETFPPGRLVDEFPGGMNKLCHCHSSPFAEGMDSNPSPLY